jgi:dihydrodiol dehydrogenase / D-xylose 1-dehydrogenase (NADP)
MTVQLVLVKIRQRLFEVGDCLRKGALESSIMPLDTTLAHLRIMDSIREQWGLVYPMENT